MKSILATVFILIGVGIIGFGGYRALSTLAGLYQSNLTDPLNQPEGAEKAASDRMLQGVMIGAIGVPFLLTGTVLWKRIALQKLLRRSKLG